MNAPPKRTCSQCGCTDDDCRQCIEATGEPCFWVTEDMCSACADPAVVAQALERCAERNPLSNSRCVRAPYHAGDHLDGMGKGWTRDRMRVYDAPAPTTPTNGAPDPLSFTQGVLELVVEEAKRREAVVASVRDAVDGLLGSADASDLGGWIREELEAQLAKLRTAMDPGVQARAAEPTTDETLTSKVTPLDQALAHLARLEAQNREFYARVQELEHECTRHVRDHDVANAAACELGALAERLEPFTHEPLIRSARRTVRGVARGLRAVLEPWRAPRAASSGARAASPFVQDAERFVAKHLLGMQLAPANVVQPLADAFANTFASGVLAAREADAGQAKSGEKPAGSAEHGTQAPTAGPVPAARQTARAAGKKAEEASFEARCRRREASRQRGPPSAPSAPRDVAHVSQKKTKPKKQRAPRAVRQIRSRKRGSP